MSALQRSINLRGPKFFLDGATIMFVLHLDGSTREGPRAASEADAAAHPQAWEAFKAEASPQGEVKGPADPFVPMVRFVDPEDGKPAAEEGPNARKRREAAEAQAAEAA